MVVLLNLLPMALLVLGLGLAWWWRAWWLVALSVAVWLVYATVQPTYMPKGQTAREAVPAPPHSDARVQDRVPQPDSLSTRDARMRQAVQEGLDFIP